MFSYVSLEERVPQDHPLRIIRKSVDEILRAMGKDFDGLYAKTGRPSIPPERLLRAVLKRFSNPPTYTLCSNNRISTRLLVAIHSGPVRVDATLKVQSSCSSGRQSGTSELDRLERRTPTDLLSDPRADG